MGIDDFKDWFFDILNDLDSDILADIKPDDTANTFQLIMVGGSVFEIECREAEAQGVYGEKQQKTNSVRKDKAIQPDRSANQI